VPAASAIATISAASAVVGASAFWQIAGTPRDAASATRSRCVGGGVTMSSRSGLTRSSIVSTSTYAAAPTALAADCAFAASVSHHPTTSASSIARHPARWNWLK
jgi:hypothetical protein